MSWFVPNADCNCSQCDFTAGFYYGDTIAELDITCRVVFLVANVIVGCERVPASVELVSVEITGPGGAEGPVTEYSGDDVFTGGFLWWEKFRPAAGEVYTATVTLTCGEDTVTKEYSITIPDSAATSCNCCTLREIDYISISGLTLSAASVNGTYAMQAGGPPYSWPGVSSAGNALCAFEPVTQPPLTPNPPVGSRCVDGPNVVHKCFNGSLATRYFAGGGAVFAYLPTLSTSPWNTVRVRVQYSYIFYGETSGGSCLQQNGNCTINAQQWEYEIDCNTGEATMVRYLDSDGNTSPVSGPLVSANPTVQVFFVP